MKRGQIYKDVLDKVTQIFSLFIETGLLEKSDSPVFDFLIKMLRCVFKIGILNNRL